MAFSTRLAPEEAEAQGVDTIDGVSRFGTLLRIQRLDSLKAAPAEGGKDPQVSYIGLNFARFRITAVGRQEGVLTARIEVCGEEMGEGVEESMRKKETVDVLRRELKLYYECVLRASDAELRKERLDLETSVHKMVFQAASELELPVPQKLSFLQIDSVEERAELLIWLLRGRTESSREMVGIEGRVKEAMGLAKKPASVFPNALGLPGAKGGLEARLKGKRLPELVKAAIEREARQMGSGTERLVGEKYIETLLEIPWLESSAEAADLAQAERVLQEEHSGLAEVKERILEHLAVRFRSGSSRGSVLCLHGPPGVGKTSIAQSIARAAGRAFARVALGGMGEEAELRGHRRTYVAARPGVIVQALVQAKSSNPVILLDEIDKLGGGQHAGPEHALLEILDPSQNSAFVDHYVALPLDLSRVMFICTANSLQLSAPLRDRLEAIAVPGYSREERAEIARAHLIPRQVRENGVEGLAEFDGGAVGQLVERSREPGVRSLERDIAKICRRIARRGRRELVTGERVEAHLGKLQRRELWSGVGVASGLVCSELGARVLTVEALQFRGGPQQLKVTGQSSEAMRESVELALSWMRSNLEDQGLFGSTAAKALE